MNAVVTLSEEEIDMVSGGNARDTTTGTYIRYERPAEEPGLGHVPLFGFVGGGGVRIIRGAMKVLGI